MVTALLPWGPSAAAAPARPDAGAVSAPTIPGLKGPVRVVRTTDGIAHISAYTRHDLYLTQGWVQASDRLFQMDYLRRTPSGTLAELLGPDALPSDVQLRTIGLRRAAERGWAAASPRLREALIAYAAGVNAYLSATAALPPEYQALELTTVAPWTPVDSLVIGKLVAFQLSFDLDTDNTEALQAYAAAGASNGFNGTALFETDLAAFAPFSDATTVPDATGTGDRTAAAPAGRADRTVQAAAAKLAARYRADVQRVPLLASVLHRDHSTGSNEWLISGRHTRNGRPILANDPHLGLDQPSIFYPIHLTAAGLDAAGEGFAGVPGMAQGQNRYIAWGSTTNPMDVTDTYLEAVRPDATSPSGLSTVYQGRREHVLAVPETYRANGIGDGTPDTVAVVPPSTSIPPATLIVPRRNNGPIVQLDQLGGTALSVQYTGFSATQELDAFLQWAEARNLEDFERGLQSFDVGSQNWTYADRAGNIAYFTSAELPLREDLQAGTVSGQPPYLVRNGQGGNEWLPATNHYPGQATPYEILPPAEMPHLVNPPAGWLVSANNDPAGTTLDNDPLNQLRPGGGIYYLNARYDGLRAGRITELVRGALANGRKVDADDVARMQSDTVLLDAEYFVPKLRQAFARARLSPQRDLRALAEDPAVAEAVGRLARWDFSTPTGTADGYDAADVNGRRTPPSAREAAASVAATLYATWRSRFLAGTVDAMVARYGLPVVDAQQAVTALKRHLDGQPFTSGLDPFATPGVPDADDRRALAMLRAVRTGLDRLASADFTPAFGGSTAQDDYRWGKVHRLTLDHPLGGPFSVPPGNGRFPAPTPGLAGVAVDGGWGTVDVANHDPRADAPADFTFGSGPARRYVGVLTAAGPVGRSALPGGTSALPTSRHYVDLLPAYLTDDAYPVRVAPAQVMAAAESYQVFRPRRP